MAVRASVSTGNLRYVGYRIPQFTKQLHPWSALWLQDGRWQAAITIPTTPGQQHRRTIYARTQREALQKLVQLKRQAATGTLPPDRLRITDYLDDWLEHKRRTIKPCTLDAYAFVVRAYVTPHVGRQYLDQLRPLHVQNMMRAIHASTGPDAANKARKVLFGAFRQAVKWQLIPRNPIESRHWRALQAQAGVRRVRLHDLRHLHASIAIRAGVDPKVLADRLGHARASFTLDVYTHLFESQREAGAVSVQSLIGSPNEPS